MKKDKDRKEKFNIEVSDLKRNEQLFCYTCQKWTEHNLIDKTDCKCLKCDTNKAK